MTIAWFRATAPDAADPLDHTAVLIDELRRTHTIDIIVEADAHDFVWREALRPWDLCVYELDNSRAHQFMWAYLLNYPGVVLLQSVRVQYGSGTELSREGRLADYMAGFDFDREAEAPSPLRVPLLASRSVVVEFAGLAGWLQEEFPAARVRYAPTGVRAIEQLPVNDRATAARLVVGAFGHRQPQLANWNQELDSIGKAVERVRATGVDVQVITGGPSERIIHECDVVVALPWPPYETALTPLLAGMAAGKPVVTLELDATADWPALDPQTWQPRGILQPEPPVAITLEPRDEIHSLSLALRRLASDVPLRNELGSAGRRWWQGHATPGHAAAAWNEILQQAASAAPPPRPADWPKHLGADGTELARRIRAEFGLGQDERDGSFL